MNRRNELIKEFDAREEFQIIVVEAHEHNVGAIGLWNTIRYILQNLVSEEDEYVLICEDDHQFTNEYSKDRLLISILEAKEKDADILSGGISGFTSAMRVSSGLFWVEKFSGLRE